MVALGGLCSDKDFHAAIAETRFTLKALRSDAALKLEIATTEMAGAVAQLKKSRKAIEDLEARKVDLDAVVGPCLSSSLSSLERHRLLQSEKERIKKEKEMMEERKAFVRERMAWVERILDEM